MSIVQEVKDDINGIAVLHDWLGTGGTPVFFKLAHRRAYICEMCPENKEGNWWDTTKSVVADWIRRELAMKHDLNLYLPNESKLGMCRVCGCCNRLAVWAPIIHIKDHSNPDTVAKYPNSCWKKAEMTK